MDASEDIPRGLRLEELGGTELIAGRFRNHRFPRHSHDGLMLSLIDDGLQCVVVRGTEHRGGRGTIIAVPPGEVHTGEPADGQGWSYRTVTIPSALLPGSSGALKPTFGCSTTIRHAGLLDRLIGFLAVFGRSPLLEQQEALMALLDAFMTSHATGAPARSTTGAGPQAFRRSKEFLAERLDRNVSLGELEVITGTDRYKLVRLFTDLEGIPPHAWHLQHRLQRARELLSRGESLAHVAGATGFADQAHLTRAFKRITGVTPGRYRRVDRCSTSHYGDDT